MSDTKFTPGPWCARFKRARYEITGTGGELMIQLHGAQNNAEQNANLIAAAPDLYAALEAMLQQFDADECHNSAADIEAILMAKAALAKARGES